MKEITSKTVSPPTEECSCVTCHFFLSYQDKYDDECEPWDLGVCNEPSKDKEYYYYQQYRHSTYVSFCDRNVCNKWRSSNESL